MITKVKAWVRRHMRRKPPTPPAVNAEHWLPKKGEVQWPANTTPMVLLAVNLADIADKVLTLLNKR
ncbi:hypothetical protein [Amycolatopsis sp. NBC_01286]|uniref:hypothetical protein n=1 Tax=Amycolatopsis sp. NBC_01286 TaxID=2903560 RepID=UPI002E0DBB60|nr:hypothetical protein OG570_48050 [Amycolatopsis sp. NBC_01286]